MRRQEKTILSIVMAFLAVILLGQLWLIVGVLEAYMGEAGAIGLPAAIASGRHAGTCCSPAPPA